MKSVLLIVCDGMSDRPIFELGNLTPLEAANKPNIDAITKRAITGIMHTVDIGIRPGSDVAHLSIFGYNLNKYYSGRGPFEAAGYGVNLKINDIAFRGNFATVDKKFQVSDRRAGRIRNTKILVNLFNGLEIDGIKIIVKKGVGHRVAVVLRGEGLGGNVTDTDPHRINTKLLKSKALKANKQNRKTAKIINKLSKISYELLNIHPFNKKRIKKSKLPANILLLRGAGKLSHLPDFNKKYNFFSSACIAGAGLYKGIAQLLGMDVLDIKGATGDINTDIKAKVKKALNATKKYDFVFLHIKGTDVLAEDGDFLGKKKFIEKIDKAFEKLVKKKNVLIVLTADHTTSSYLKMHTADPVPLLIAGKNIHTDNVEVFGERSVASGKLGHIQGKHLMPIIKDLLGRAPLFGA